MNAAEAAAKLADRCKSLCENLLPNGVVERNEFVVGNIRGDVGRSLAVHLAGEKSGVWCDFDSGEAGDLIGLIKATKGLTTVEAVTWAAGWLGEPVDGAATAPAATGAEPVGDNTKFALEIWRSARPAAVITETYFAARGLRVAIPPTIRETPGLKHRPSGLSLPAIVCAVQAPSGAIVGIHRTYLSPDLKTKAPVKQPRMMLGPLAGNVVRLGPATEKLLLTEGLKNALSVFQSCPGHTVWCCLSVFNLAPQLPDQVKEIIMCLDGDLPGSPAFEASEKAVQKLISRGLKVRKFRAPPGMDHNDLLQLPANVVPLKIKETAHG